MSAAVTIVCYKSKTLANEEHLLMLCISKNRKRKCQSLGISINPKYWDFDKSRPKNNCPNRDYIIKIIIDKELEYQKKILELKADDVYNN